MTQPSPTKDTSPGGDNKLWSLEDAPWSGLPNLGLISLTVRNGGGPQPLAPLRSAATPTAPATLAITPLAATKAEGNSGPTLFTFTLTRTGNLVGSSTATWGISGFGAHGANAADFGGAFPSGTVSFAPGQSTQTLAITVVGDSGVEKDEAFSLTLSAPSSGTVLKPSASQARGTIRNDDSLLSIAALSASKPEGSRGSTAYTFRVTRTGDTQAASNALWQVSGIGVSAADRFDFQGDAFPSGTVSFAARQTSRTITILVNGDLRFEPNDSFAVTLSAPSQGTSLSPSAVSATGLIRNDDALGPPTLAISALEADKPEGLSQTTTPFTFLISRDGLATATATVGWQVNGSGSSAAGNSDFIPSKTGGMPFGAVTFSPGESAKTISVDVAGDLLQEENEGFVVQLFNESGATVTTRQAFGTIRHDDWIGDSLADTLIGTELAEYLDGAGSADLLTGRGGADVFGFRFSYTPPGNTPSQSTPTNPDTITDFAFGSDKIALVDFDNFAYKPFPPAPATLSRASDSAAATLAELAAAVFADADGASVDNQGLPAKGAVLVKATNPAIAGVYILVNDDDSTLSPRNDLLIKLGSGFSGALPALGTLVPGVLFV